MLSLLLTLISSSCSSPPALPTAMQQPDPILQELERLEDEVFFKRPQQLPEALEASLLWAPRHQLAIAAPRQVELSVHQDLPVLVLASNSKARRSLVEPSTHTALLAVNLETGKLSCSHAFPPDPAKTLPAREDGSTHRELPPSFPDGLDSEEASLLTQSLPATLSRVWLDAVGLGAVLPEPARLALRVIELERLSASAVTKLVQEGQPAAVHAGPPAEQAREAELEARRLHSATGGLGSFRRGDETPELQGEGCAFQTLTAQAAGSASLPFHGVARLELGAGMLVSAADSKVPAEDLPQVLVPVYILLTEIGRNEPRIFEILIPHSANQPLVAGQVVELCFSLDLGERLAAPLLPGTYFLYLIAGPHASGPWRLDKEAS